jgi:hypothetical protein
MHLPTTTIQALEKEPYTEVWVSNTSSILNHLTAKQEIPQTSLQIKDSVWVTLPASNVPVLLTNYSSKKDILESPTIRQALSNSFIVLLDTAACHEMLKNPSIAKMVTDAARVHKVSSEVSGTATNTIDVTAALGMPASTSWLAPVSAPEPEAAKAVTADIAVRSVVHDVVTAYNAVGTRAQDLIDALNNIQPTEQEKDFLRQHISDPVVRRVL